jgi:hypothetical protein
MPAPVASWGRHTIAKLHQRGLQQLIGQIRDQF